MKRRLLWNDIRLSVTEYLKRDYDFDVKDIHRGIHDFKEDVVRIAKQNSPEAAAVWLAQKL